MCQFVLTDIVPGGALLGIRTGTKVIHRTAPGGTMRGALALGTLVLATHENNEASRYKRLASTLPFWSAPPVNCLRVAA